MKGKTIRQVIDESYWYFQRMMTWNIQFEKDVIDYHNEIRTKIYKLLRNVKY